jgi:hypothetical protein
MSENWGSVAAQKLRKRLEAKQRDGALLLENRRLLEEQGPGLWQQVRQNVKKMCDQLNADYGEQVVTIQDGRTDELNVQLRFAGTTSELRATFDTSTSTEALKWTYAGLAARSTSSGKYFLHNTNGVVVLQSGTVPSTTELVARQMLDGLLAE